MTTPREIAEKLVSDALKSELVHVSVFRRADLASRIIAALESYGRECRNAALEEASEKLVELHRQLDERNTATRAWIQSDTQCRAYANSLERELRALKEKP